MRLIDLIETKPISGLLLGAVSLGTFTMIDPDWHGMAVSFLDFWQKWPLYVIEGYTGPPFFFLQVPGTHWP
jgi:hypothetical protein